MKTLKMILNNRRITIREVADDVGTKLQNFEQKQLAWIYGDYDDVQRRLDLLKKVKVHGCMAMTFKSKHNHSNDSIQKRQDRKKYVKHSCQMDVVKNRQIL